MRDFRGASARRWCVREKGIVMKTQLLAALGAAGALMVLGAQPASAQSNADYVSASYEVTYGDLDLSSEAGAATFFERLQSAAERVCGRNTMDRQSRTARQARACSREAMERAVDRARDGSMRTRYAAWRAGEFEAPQRTVELAADEARARVVFADLDLSNRRGRAALDRRIARATRQVCGTVAWSRRVAAAQRVCAESVTENARVQVAAILANRQYAAAEPAPHAVTAASERPVILASTSPQAISAATPATAPVADGYGICAARTHSANFASQSSQLDRAARLDVGYAVDSASVCTLERITIAADRNNALALRRAASLRSAVIANGVPAAQVIVERTDDASAQGSRADLSFSGVARSSSFAEVAPAGV